MPQAQAVQEYRVAKEAHCNLLGLLHSSPLPRLCLCLLCCCYLWIDLLGHEGVQRVLIIVLQHSKFASLEADKYFCQCQTLAACWLPFLRTILCHCTCSTARLHEMAIAWHLVQKTASLGHIRLCDTHKLAGLAVLMMAARSNPCGVMPVLVCRSLEVQHMFWKDASSWP